MMDSCLFAQNFWGEKNTGFDVLYQNLKLSCRSTSDFAEFVRDSFSIEDTYYKSLLKLAKQTGSYSNNNHGSFKPCWPILRQLVDQLGQLHSVFAQNRQSLSKDVQKYLEDQQKRHKSIRDAESSTQEVVHAFQVTAVQLHRAKEVYHSRYAEYERTIRSESSSTREQEKLEAKLKKAQDEYKYSVEKYNNLRNQFVSKMSASCAQFQEVEVAHLEQMREFMQRYSSVWSTARDIMDKLCAQFDQDLTNMTTGRLLELFVADRGTGTTEPLSVPFEDAEVAAAFSPSSEHPTVGVHAVDVFAKEQRASSALAAVGSASKENGDISQNSLTDLSADAVSVASGSLAAVPTANAAGGGTATMTKRRDGFFRRRRNSLTQEPGLSTSETTTTTDALNRLSNIQPIGGSLSAFNVVAKRGIRLLGTPLSNGKDKLTTKQDSKSASSLTEDWRVAATSELPKDEEGFTIRPSDPWAETASDNHSDEDGSDSDSDVDVVGRTFKGLKVNIRPPGDFAPQVATLSSPKKPVPSTRQAASVKLPTRGQGMVLVDLRGAKHGSKDTVGGSVGTSNSLSPTTSENANPTPNLIQALPTAPALPPPPPPQPASTSRNVDDSMGPSDDLSFLMNPKDSGVVSLARPRASGTHSFNRMDSEATANQLHGTLSKRFQLDLLSLDPLFSPSTAHERAWGTCGPSGADTWEHTGAQSRSVLSDTFTSPAVRRCASAVPPSPIPTDGPNRPDKNMAQLAWQPFESDSSGALWHTASNVTNPGIPWNKQLNNVPPHGPTFDPEIPSERTTPTQSVPSSRTESKISGNQGSAMSIPSLSSIPTSVMNQPPNQLGVVSVAAAFTETWRARFHNGGGSSFSTAAMITPPPIQAVSGELTLAFPRAVIEQLVSQSRVGSLVLRLNNAIRFKDLQLKIVGSSMVGCPLESPASKTGPNHGTPVDYVLTIPGSVLTEQFVSLLSDSVSSKPAASNATPAAASYLKLDVLSYSVDVAQGSNLSVPYPALAPPIHLCTYWRCDQSVTDFRLDYATRWPSDGQTMSRVGRGDLRINLNVDGGVNRMQSLPVGTWIPEVNRATWQIPLVPSADDPGTTVRDGSVDSSGTVRAKFTLDHGPGRPQPVALQFFREDCLASGVQLVLDCPDYRLSLCKRRIIGDRYICDPPNHSTRFQLHPLPTTKPTTLNQPSPPARAVVSHSDDRWMTFPAPASTGT